MSANSNIQHSSGSALSHSKWDLKIVRFELEQLKREREHLDSKKNERHLTDWELERIEQISSEMGGLVKMIVELR